MTKRVADMTPAQLAARDAANARRCRAKAENPTKPDADEPGVTVAVERRCECGAAFYVDRETCLLHTVPADREGDQ